MATGKTGMAQQAGHVVEAGLEIGQMPGRSGGGDWVIEAGVGPLLLPLAHTCRERAVIRRCATRGRLWVAQEIPQMRRPGDPGGGCGDLPIGLDLAASV